MKVKVDGTTTFLVVVGYAILTFLFIFGMPIVAALFGAFTGWVVGFVFPVTFNTFFSALGLGMLVPWQIGMMLGFVGGFFRGVLKTGILE